MVTKECIVHGARHFDNDCETRIGTARLLSRDLEMHLKGLSVFDGEDPGAHRVAIMEDLRRRVAEISILALERALRVLKGGNQWALNMNADQAKKGEEPDPTATTHIRDTQSLAGDIELEIGARKKMTEVKRCKKCGKSADGHMSMSGYLNFIDHAFVG